MLREFPSEAVQAIWATKTLTAAYDAGSRIWELARVTVPTLRTGQRFIGKVSFGWRITPAAGAVAVRPEFEWLGAAGARLGSDYIVPTTNTPSSGNYPASATYSFEVVKLESGHDFRIFHEILNPTVESTQRIDFAGEAVAGLTGFSFGISGNAGAYPKSVDVTFRVAECRVCDANPDHDLISFPTLT